MQFPEVKGKVVEFVQASAQTEGAFVNIRFTDKTDLGFTFNAKMKLDYVTLNDVTDGNYELIKEYIKMPSGKSYGRSPRNANENGATLFLA
jgi:hypothetical protein